MTAFTQPLVLQEAKRVAGRGCRKGLQEEVTGAGSREGGYRSRVTGRGCRKGLQEEGCRSRVTGRGYRKGVTGAGLREGVAGRGLQEGGNQKKMSVTKFAVNPMSTDY